MNDVLQGIVGILGAFRERMSRFTGYFIDVELLESRQESRWDTHGMKFRWVCEAKSCRAIGPASSNGHWHQNLGNGSVMALLEPR
jgi:hypothetical protein